jgi:F420-dependent methylenetetrahydromethanopterin dehydrogenase
VDSDTGFFFRMKGSASNYEPTPMLQMQNTLAHERKSSINFRNPVAALEGPQKIREVLKENLSSGIYAVKEA